MRRPSASCPMPRREGCSSPAVGRPDQALLEGLKPREREVFQLVAAGMANKRIAARLGVCLQTVKLHRGRLMRKLQLPSVAELVRLAEQARSPLPSL